ncbi:MAG TPA: hypothetical protein V6D22_24225 [Candidatus Obscuribacterales bacterium]
MAFHPNEVGGRGSEGGQERVQSPFESVKNSNARAEAVSLLGSKNPAAQPKELAAPIASGADMLGAKDRFSNLLKQATPQDKTFNPAQALAQKGTGLDSQAGRQAFDTVHGAMVHGNGMDNNRQTSQPHTEKTPPPAANPHMAETTADKPHKKAS